jgi:large subunit ribosomal protein L13
MGHGIIYRLLGIKRRFNLMRGNMATYMAKPKDIQRAWYLVDAKDKILGRLASKVAAVLIGKGKVIYSPHYDAGDEVIVINASKIKVTGTKLGSKTYKRYSAYPGGLKEEVLAIKLKNHPDYVIRHAVKGMLPKSKLGAKLLKKLKVYADENHPHKAQSPKPLAV